MLQKDVKASSQSVGQQPGNCGMASAWAAQRCLAQAPHGQTVGDAGCVSRLRVGLAARAVPALDSGAVGDAPGLAILQQTEDDQGSGALSGRPHSKIAGAMRWCGGLNTHPTGAAGFTSTWQKLPTRQVVKAQGLVAAAGMHWGLPFCGRQRAGGQQSTSDAQSEAKRNSTLQQQRLWAHLLRRSGTSRLQSSANAAAKTGREQHVQTAAALTSSGWHSRPSLQRALAHTLMHWALPSCTQ